jgi:hypothetical protein
MIVAWAVAVDARTMPNTAITRMIIELLLRSDIRITNSAHEMQSTLFIYTMRNGGGVR